MHSRKSRHRNRNSRTGNNNQHNSQNSSDNLQRKTSSSDYHHSRPEILMDHKQRGLANWITVYIDNKAYTAIFVSGAYRTLIKSSIVSSYECTSERPALNTIGNSPIETKGIVNVPLTLDLDNNFKVNYDFVMVDDIPNVDIVLGIDFMCRFNVSLDFANSVATLRDKKNVCSVTLNQEDVDSLTPKTHYLHRVLPASGSSTQSSTCTLNSSDLASISDDNCENVPITSTFPLSARKQALLHKEIKRLLNAGIIRPSTSWWCSPVDIIERKAPGEIPETIVVVDYRNVNKFSKPDHFRLPSLISITDRLAGCSHFSVLHLRNAFHQIPLKEKDKKKTAFSTPSGHYEYNFLPVGLRNATSTLQRRMCKVLDGLIGNLCAAYLGDILIYSSNYENHMIHLRSVLDRLRQAGLVLDKKKCLFCLREVKFLGFVLCEDGWKIDPDKISNICNHPTPANIRGVRKFFGLINVYRKFVPKFAEITKPLQDLTKRGTKFKWLSRNHEAFKYIKSCLKPSPVLWYPNFLQPFKILTECSRVSINAILFQEMNNVQVPLCYASRMLKNIEFCYSDVRREVFAIVWAIDYFHSYLSEAPFFLYTDKVLLFDIFLNQPQDELISKWLLELKEYNYSVVDRSDLEGADTGNLITF